MRKIEDLKKIENKRYSVKQALAYYIVSFKSAKEKDFESIMKKLIETLIDMPDENKVLEQTRVDLIVEIKNYWSLTVDQVVSYAHILFYNLTFAGQKFTKKDILSEFIFVMRLYSPNNAEEFVERQMERMKKRGVQP